jgi:hypothetical protein
MQTLRFFFAISALALVCILKSASSTHAQAFERGTKLLSVGLELRDGWTPLLASFETGVSEKIGVGGKVAYASPYGFNILQAGLFGNYHFPVNSDEFDLYSGAGLSLWRFGYRDGFYGNYSESYVGLNLQGGGRYFFTEKVGAFGQLGVDIWEFGSDVTFSLGVSFKF